MENGVPLLFVEPGDQSVVELLNQWLDSVAEHFERNPLPCKTPKPLALTGAVKVNIRLVLASHQSESFALPFDLLLLVRCNKTFCTQTSTAWQENEDR